MNSYLPLIAGMAAVTYIPRLIPLLLMTERPLHPLLRRFLVYIPYTALSALVIRGIFQSEPGMRLATILGIAAAGVCSFFKGKLVLSVLVSIVTVFIILHI